jgi:hypothetical protein
VPRMFRSLVDSMTERAPALGVVGLCIMLGLWARKSLAISSGDQWLGEQLGTLLWGVMWYAIVRLVSPKRSCVASALVALAITLGIELFQLTGIPGELNKSHRLWGLALGTSFDIMDLVMCAVGVIAAGAIHAQFVPKRSSRS